MNIQQIRKSINFIEENDELLIMPYSYSGAITIKINRNNKKYFLKIMKYYDKCLEKIDLTVKIYKDCNVPMAKVLEQGLLLEYNKYYVVYSFIDGTPFNELYNLRDINFFYEKGKEIAKYLKSLKEYDIRDNKLIQFRDLKETTTKVSKNFCEIYSKIEQIINKYFTNEQIKIVNDRFFELEKSFDNIKPNLIHADIKTQNIIICQEKAILVDYENLEINYDIINFRYNIDSYFNSNNIKKSRAFYNGILHTLYDNKISKTINDNMLYTAILNFFSEMFYAYKAGKLERLEYLIKLYKKAYYDTKQFHVLE